MPRLGLRNEAAAFNAATCFRHGGGVPGRWCRQGARIRAVLVDVSRFVGRPGFGA
jgi:hypothetical protein